MVGQALIDPPGSTTVTDVTMEGETFTIHGEAFKCSVNTKYGSVAVVDGGDDEVLTLSGMYGIPDARVHLKPAGGANA